MVRSFMMLLMLIIVFLTGMLFGVEKSGYTIDSESNEEVTQEQEPSSSQSDKNNKDTEENNEKSDTTTKVTDVPNDGEQNITQQTATFLEKGVKKFYDLIVEMMYQLSSAFF